MVFSDRVIDTLHAPTVCARTTAEGGLMTLIKSAQNQSNNRNNLHTHPSSPTQGELSHDPLPRNRGKLAIQHSSAPGGRGIFLALRGQRTGWHVGLRPRKRLQLM